MPMIQMSRVNSNTFTCRRALTYRNQARIANVAEKIPNHDTEIMPRDDPET